MTRAPSRGRGPNAAFYDRLTARETNRVGWYPSPGYYLRSVRRALEIVDRGGRVRLDWMDCDGVDAAALRAEFRRALHARISAKGGIRYSRHNDAHTRGLATEFKRDKWALEDRNARNVAIRSFHSRACRERLGHLVTSYSLND